MRDELAERVLAKVMDWGSADVAHHGMDLQMLAAHKYDSYGGYRPGVKFLEHLGGWLDQLDSLEDRKTAATFVRDDLVFISNAELDHLIETVYPDYIRPMLVARAAERLGRSRFAVDDIVGSDSFRLMLRKLLVLGLSDGARIDRLRRLSPGLSHEQIFLAADIASATAEDAVEKLRAAVDDETACFEHVLLVDDFYGSGYTLLRKSPEGGSFEGRLWRTRQRIEDLREDGKLSADCIVTILVYIASTAAVEYVTATMAEAEIEWDLLVVLPLESELKVSDADLARICEWHYDDVLVNEDKPERAPMGFRDAGLPLVLPHNTPNNSVCILWADTTDRDDSTLKRRALFPRYERHREDRR